MRPDRVQLGSSLLVRCSRQLLLVNLVAFFICFSLLCSMEQGGGDVAQADKGLDRPASIAAPAYAPRQSWFKSITITDKTKALSRCYSHTDEVPRPFNVTEWAAWKQRSAVWFQEIGLPGFIKFSETLLTLKKDGTFEPLFPGAGPISDILTDHEQQRHVLKVLAQVVWTLPDMPSVGEIELASSFEVAYQFKALSGILYKLLGAIIASTTPDKESGVSIYSHLLNTTRGPLMLSPSAHNPMAACMTFIHLNSKFRSDPSGSTKDMEDKLQLFIATVSKGPASTLTLWNLRDFSTKVQAEYYAIADRDPKGVYSLNRNVQESMRKGIQYTCLRAEKELSDDMQLAASNLREAVTKLHHNLDFATFSSKLIGFYTEFIPASSGDAAKTKIQLPTVAQTGPAGSIAMAATKGPATCQPCCSQTINDAIKSYGMAAVTGALKISNMATSTTWMCENCCELGHKSFECKAAAHPQREQLLKAHKEAKVAQNSKMRQRRAAQGGNTGPGRNAPSNNDRQQRQAQGNHGGSSTQRQVSGVARQGNAQLRIQVPNDNSRNVRARVTTQATVDEAMAAWGLPAGTAHLSVPESGAPSRFRELTQEDEDYHMSSHLTIPTVTITTPDPAKIYLPIILLLAMTGVLASQVSAGQDDLLISLTTILLPIVCGICILAPSLQGPETSPARSQPPARPRRVLLTCLRNGCTASLIVMAILLHLFIGADAGKQPSNSSLAFMTSAERLSTVFIDTGCSRTLFCSSERLINVRPLVPPVQIGGAVPGSVIAHHVGDYPLTLKDEQGCLHLSIIKDCMVSDTAQANLLSHNELQSVNIGILVPDNSTDPALLYWQKRGAQPGTKAYSTMGRKHGLIPLPGPDGQLVEISGGTKAAAYFTRTLSAGYAFQSIYHQLRPLTVSEKWHHRLNHAHPSKIAKLSHNCIGMTPLAEFQVPCHDCMDANIRRSDLPPASQRTNTGVWNVDMIDMGPKNLTIGKNRYATIFTIADSRYVMIFLHKTKDEFHSILKQALAKTDKKPKVLRTDGAGEYLTPAVNKTLIDEGIQKETTNPEEQFGNGKAETMVGSTGRGMRTALLSSNLPIEFWGLAAQNWIDVYNHLPHASLDFKTPFEAEMGSTPDVSWFRPFGCRVTVFRGRDRVDHHKLSPRGEACVYVGIGRSHGQKGWMCWCPRTQRTYCTRHCVFDETFMPMRLTDQRILGYYDATPRTKMLKQQFGSLEAAAKAAEDIWDMPVEFTPEAIDPDSPELSETHPHIHVQESEEICDDFDLSSNKRPAPLAAQAPADKRPRTAQASGGTAASTQASGGTAASTQASGGTAASTQASGGTAASTQARGGTAASTQASGGTSRARGAAAQTRSTKLLPTGGANTGVDPAMLSAGDHGTPSDARLLHGGNQTLDDHFDWTTLGPRLISDVNNFELTEFLIGNGITLIFQAEWWPNARTPGPWEGFVHDTTTHPNPRSRWARIWLFTTKERHQVRIVGDTQLNIRDAVTHTYPNAVTLDDLHSDFLGSDLPKERFQGKPTAAKQAPRRNATVRCAAMAFECLQEALGVKSEATKIAHVRRDEDKLRINDSVGCAYAAYVATSYVCMLAESYGYNAAFIPPEPRSQREARSRADSDRWEQAERKELSTLWKMGTFLYTARPPFQEYDPLPLHFIYKLKVKDCDFKNVTYKARLVMRGNLQYDHEYGETYAPTARMWSLRTMLAIAAQEDLQLMKFDLTGAFLVADMDTKMHVEIPGHELSPDKAILLKKALYGGRSSGALYAKEITTWLLNYGFAPTSVDETLFRKERKGTKGTEVILLSLYVDDGACATNSPSFYKQFIKDLSAKYELSDQGPLKWHLGMKFAQNLKNGTIKIDQQAYIESMLERFNMQDANERDTPAIPKIRLSKASCPRVPDKNLVKPYQQLVGSLMYVACATRPDIAYAVNSCAQFMSNPGLVHLEAAKHILRYLKGTKTVGITYSKQTDDKLANKLVGYVDADHAADVDDRKSVGGYVLLLNGGAISWSSRKIKVVAISSFESEWYSASICGCEVKAMRRLLEEMGYAQSEPTSLLEDNAACIYSSEADRPMNPCSKHIDTRVFKLKEFVSEGTLKLVKVASVRQVADNLTKPLAAPGIEMARGIMSGEESAHSTRVLAGKKRALFGYTL